MEKVCVVVPFYKSVFNDIELISLKRLKEVLHSYPVFFIIPKSLECDFQNNIFGFDYVCFSDECFADIFSYNRLCLSEQLYNRFINYEYILIHQTDAFVFSDRLLEFCSMGFDYIGASWEDWTDYCVQDMICHSYVGNGGFSLRKTTSCLNMITKYKDIIRNWKCQEDLFFAYCGDYLDHVFRVAPREIAWKFSAETFPRYIYRINDDTLPFGCHAWHKADKDFYIETFQKMGINLYPYKQQLSDFHIGDNLKNDSISAMGILLYRRTFTDILKKYPAPFDLICIDGYGVDLARKLLETGSEIDVIYVFGVQGQEIAGRNTSSFDIEILSYRKTSNTLIVLGKCDEEFLELLNSNDYSYGTDYISLKQEYERFLEGKKKIQTQIKTEFPFALFPKHSKVLIYGAGQRDLHYYTQALQSTDIDIVGIVDPDAGKSFLSGLNVKPLSAIKTLSFDYILIAINYLNYAEERKADLIQMGVASPIIKWKMQFSSKRGFVLFGCGHWGQIIIKELEKFGIRFLYGVDKKLYGESIEGIEIKAPNVLDPAVVHEYIVISSTLYGAEMAEELIELGFQPYSDFCLYDDLKDALWAL